jgi:hypothetical protein
MPFDSTGFADPKVETQTECDLAILRRARYGIALPGGWCQGALQFQESRCALGWLLAESRYHDNDAYSFLTRAFVGTSRRLNGPRIDADLVAFNDAHGRKQSEMVKLFDRAIKRLERQCLTE